MKSFILLFSIFSFSILFAQQAPEIEWSRNYGGSDFEEAYDIKQTPDGGYIVVGYTMSIDGDVSENKGESDYWLLKLNSMGNIEWEKSYGGSNEDYAYSVVLTQDGGYLVAGQSFSNDGDVGENYGSEFTSDIWLIKISGSGELISKKNLGGSFSERFPTIIKTSDGFALISITESSDFDVSNNYGGSDYWLVKLSEDLEIQWEKSYGGSLFEGMMAYNPPKVIQLEDGGFIISGESESNNGDLTENYGNNDFWIFQTNNVGELVWQKSYGGNGYDFAQSIIKLSNGNYFITGFSTSIDGNISNPFGENPMDIWTIMIDESGELIWEKSYGGFSSDYGSTIVEATDGSIIMGSVSLSDDGNVSNNYGAFDVWVAKINLNGEIIWEKNYGGSAVELIDNTILSSDGKIIFAGLSRSEDFDLEMNNGETDFWIVKLGSEQMSTSEINSSQISIYPNPVKNILNFSEELNDIQIFNLAGQKVLESSDKNKINVSHLNSGTFVLKAKNQKGKSVQLKFIKN